MINSCRTGVYPAMVLLVAYACCFELFADSKSANFTFATATDPLGLKPVSCWFEAGKDWPESQCYDMQVRENHADSKSPLVSFPLVVFKSTQSTQTSNPVLHLGAGGPGGSLHLDSKESVKGILEAYDALSLDIGRDLYLIDPRGAGLSRPLLTCIDYVDHEVDRLAKNLTFKEKFDLSYQDYSHCIERFKQQGIDFNFYNSIAIIHDVELLRKALQIDQWVLVGVSYAAVYAQFLARYFPETVEALILDSPVFPAIKIHHNYLERVLTPYRLLFQNCGDEDGCADENESLQIQALFWGIHKHLNNHPINLIFSNPNTRKKLPVSFNGERFLNAVSEGVYGTQIFTQLKQILIDLNVGNARSVYPYFKGYLAFALDKFYGDISAEAHYCFEDKPFIDFDLIRKLSNDLPQGYIRETAQLALDLPDFCEQMDIKAGNPELGRAAIIDSPTLLLQGTLDAITPMIDIKKQIANFRQSELLTFDLSHDILGSSSCAEKIAAIFIKNKKIGRNEEICE